MTCTLQGNSRSWIQFGLLACEHLSRLRVIVSVLIVHFCLTVPVAKPRLWLPWIGVQSFFQTKLEVKKKKKRIVLWIVVPKKPKNGSLLVFRFYLSIHLLFGCSILCTKWYKSITGDVDIWIYLAYCHLLPVAWLGCKVAAKEFSSHWLQLDQFQLRCGHVCFVANVIYLVIIPPQYLTNLLKRTKAHFSQFSILLKTIDWCHFQFHMTLKRHRFDEWGPLVIVMMSLLKCGAVKFRSTWTRPMTAT